VVWSTFMRASGTTNASYSYSSAIDADGFIYITGPCDDNYPVTPGVYQSTYGGGTGDAYVTKLNRNGTEVIYTTYLGGSDFDAGEAIVVNSNGEAIVGGKTRSNDYPTTAGAIQEDYGGGQMDAFVTKINSQGTDLIFSSYLGGFRIDVAFDIDLDKFGNAYIVGDTESPDFPVSNGAFQKTLQFDDAFITKVNDSGQLVYSTFLGGVSGEGARAIVVDSIGQAFVTGVTNSFSTFPVTSGAFQTSFGGGVADLYIAKFSVSGSSLIYASFLGGSGHDLPWDIDVDRNGNAYLLGTTESTDFPVTVGVIQSTNKGQYDVAVTKVNPSGSQMIYSTYLGGTGDDKALGIAANTKGECYIIGATLTNDLVATPGAIQSSLAGAWDLFIAHIDKRGKGFSCGGFTYFGGSKADYGFPDMILDESGMVDTIIMNSTSHSDDFPTTPGVYQPTKLNAAYDQPVVFKMTSSTQLYDVTPDRLLCKGESIKLRAKGGSEYRWSPGSSLSDSTVWSPTARPDTTTTYTVIASGSCSPDTQQVTITVVDIPIINAKPDTIICYGESVMLSAEGGVTYSWTPTILLNNPNIQNPLTSPHKNTTYYVTVIDNNGCSNIDSLFIIVNQLPITDAGTDTRICVGDSIQLYATGGVNYAWTPSNSLTDPASPNPIAFPGSTTSYEVTVTDSFGCSNSNSVLIKVDDPIQADAGSDIEFCFGDSGVFSPNLDTSKIIVFHWSPSNGLDDSTSMNPLVIQDSTTVYILHVSNTCNESYDTVNVIVNPLPEVDAGKNAEIMWGNTTQLSATPDFVDYTWEPSTGLNNNSIFDPIAGPITTTSYQVVVTDTNGCKGSDVVDVKVITDLQIEVPTGFTPNGDGLNDIFLVYDRFGGTGFQSFDLRVYNRWGELVFHSTDISEGWDGKNMHNSKDMEIGTYVWMLSITKKDGVVEEPMVGNVSLIR